MGQVGQVRHGISTALCYRYSVAAPHQGALNEFAQNMFPWRNKKNMYLDTHPNPDLFWLNTIFKICFVCLNLHRNTHVL